MACRTTCGVQHAASHAACNRVGSCAWERIAANRPHYRLLRKCAFAASLTEHGQRCPRPSRIGQRRGVRALLAVLRARSALRVLRSAGVPAALEREREWVPRAAHRWQPTTHSARCAAAAAERRTTSALKYSLFTYASSSWQSRHRVDRVAGARRGAASQPWERIRPHPSAGSMAGMGAGRHGTSTRLLAEWLHSSWVAI
jgi:hypothetical protein